MSFIVTTNYSARMLKRTLPLPVVRAVLGLTAFLAAIALAALILAGIGAYQFGRLSYLEYRNRQLEAEFNQLITLKERLVDLEEQRKRMAEMLGVELTPAPVDWGAPPPDSGVMAGMTLGSRPVPSVAPLDDYVVSRGFSPAHPAMDLAAQSGTSVRAAADGIVAELGTDSVFGLFLLLRHTQGYETYYAHLTDWKVRVADTVQAGQVIGTVGSTGRSSAPHLHFEVRRDGECMNPTWIVKQ
ncbi:MAG: M23 family metallopeptidase [candidate division WOR-3 bacterium]